jgi:hypothetical protein
VNQLRRHRPSADGKRIEEEARRLRQRAQARREHVGERLGPIGSGFVKRHVSRQLLENKRTPAGLTRDSEPLRRVDRRLRRNQRSDERLGFRVLHVPERQGHATVGPASVEQRLKKRLRRRLLAAKAEQRQQRWRRRRPQQFFEQHDAVRIGPMQIVDREDQRMTRRDGGQQFAQRGERPAPQDERVGDLVLLRRAGRDGPDLQDDREQPRQREDVAGQQPLGFRSGQGGEIAAQTVDDFIERLYGTVSCS